MASVALTSTSATAVLVGTATPGAVVRVRDRQTVADASGGWRITVDLVPGRNLFQTVATGQSGLQVATDFTVTYTPIANPAATTAAIPTDTTAAAPPTVANATPTVAVNVPVTISSPLDGAVVSTRRITVSGTAAPGVRVNAAGTFVTATRKGLWSAFVTLVPGVHEVTVTATTPAGVTTATSITVRYNPPPTTTTSAETAAPTETRAAGPSDTTA